MSGVSLIRVAVSSSHNLLVTRAVSTEVRLSRGNSDRDRVQWSGVDASTSFTYTYWLSISRPSHGSSVSGAQGHALEAPTDCLDHQSK
jgi:hypothetical protein